MTNKLESIEKLTLGLNTFLGISLTFDDVYAILGIIILAFQVLSVVVRTIVKIIDKIKAKKYDEIDDVIEEATEDISEIKEGIK